MVDVIALKQILSLESAAWVVVALVFLLVVRMWNGAPALFEQWIIYKQTKAAEKVSDWNRLREEITRLSESEQQCRRGDRACGRVGGAGGDERDLRDREQCGHGVDPSDDHGERRIHQEQLGGARKIHVVQNWFAAFRK